MPDLQSARASLIAKRDELEERVRRIDADLRKRDEPMSADFAEQVVEQENLDALYAIASEGRLELQKVVHALARNGTTSALVFGSHFASAQDALFEAAEDSGLRIASGLAAHGDPLFEARHALIRRFEPGVLVQPERGH